MTLAWDHMSAATPILGSVASNPIRNAVRIATSPGKNRAVTSLHRFRSEDFLEIKYYVVSVSDAGFGHGDEIHLIKIGDGRVIGYSSEFDTCTADIADACVAERTDRAKWFAWNEGWEWRAANLEEIRNLGLAGYLVGSKKDMKVTTKIDPL
ncbi:hypothetical protein [Burkholderia sp. Bp9090]|uniref:hypothetical protein n=1 Tax=Burkholderia sp. Bp9090 TaxID=2184567 RepID=UPI000F5E0B7E|nr:hypothetical protein [Burkholderia sp. Bp9090]